ncbi:glucose-1-phosphate cytidylyltransferase [Insolitispirillum peregrinum]|uniref:glucose-1-phosphate cytidylyltransferase n=1 Tax=Insolitispirillum peregrinum TaxID=80876 RepID=UPI0036106F03
MKVVILAGGLGTRLAEETSVRPKPMVEIGGKPILWHIMKIYAAHGLNDFVICLGYKGYMVKEYFSNYFLHNSDVTIDVASNSIHTHQNTAEPWKITLVDTGDNSMTGGRIKRIAPYLGDDENFCLTYGDGVSDVNVTELLEFHKRNARLATVTAVHPPRRFGVLELDNDTVTAFEEKPQAEGGWINGGFFVLSRKVIDYIDADETIWEREPLKRLTAEGQLSAYRHSGFWQPMDTLRDKQYLEELWTLNSAPWKTW